MLLRQDTNPGACNASGDDRSKESPREQAEEPRSGNQVEASSEPPTESTRYPRRERRPPAYLNNYVTYLDESSIDRDQVLYSIDYCYKVSSFPQTYQEAIEFPELEHWKAAMKEEMNRPFPSSCLLPLQSESKCEVFLMRISFHSYVK